jgi:hypothetical protein
MSSISYLPPPNIRLPAELRQAVLAAAGNDPQRRARLERRARRQWLEYGLQMALATLVPPAPR